MYALQHTLPADDSSCRGKLRSEFQRIKVHNCQKNKKTNVYFLSISANLALLFRDKQATLVVGNHSNFPPNPTIKSAIHTTISTTHPSAFRPFFPLFFASERFCLSLILRKQCQKACKHLSRRATSWSMHFMWPSAIPKATPCWQFFAAFAWSWVASPSQVRNASARTMRRCSKFHFVLTCTTNTIPMPIPRSGGSIWPVRRSRKQYSSMI